MVAALEALVVGQQDEGLCVAVELGGGLLDGGEALVDAGQRLLADRVGALNVRRDELVGLGEVGQEGCSEGLVGRVAELKRALRVGVGVDSAGDGVDAVGDDGVVEEVLLSSVSL